MAESILLHANISGSYITGDARRPTFSQSFNITIVPWGSVKLPYDSVPWLMFRFAILSLRILRLIYRDLDSVTV